jgi:alkaline phosphatase D
MTQSRLDFQTLTPLFKLTMRIQVFIAVLIVAFTACQSPKQQLSTNTVTIAFGSCGDQRLPQPVLDLVVAQKPDLFLYLGDNIYSDTYSMDTLQKNYARLAARPEFQRLKATVPLLATWDDHDFGWNDSGRHYPFKEDSKKIFLEFFGDQGDSTLATHPGIYHTAYWGEAPHRIQIIMPDMRTFRDKLLPYNGNRAADARFKYDMDYSPYTTADSTLLGEAQWQWLEQQLLMPANLRIIATSTQFGITHNGYEAWANFPHEQKRLLDLIKKTKAEGVLFVSGDVHYAEISKLAYADLYPLYDVTASGITSTWDFATPNDNRIDGPVMENHYGLLRIDWSAAQPEISMEIHDVSGKQRIKRVVSLSQLKF